MTPAETEPYSPNGEPRAYASLPCWTAAGLPSVAGTRIGGGCSGAEHRDVVLGLRADDLGGRRRAVGEGELDRGRAVDDVEAGEDVAVEVDDDAAAEAVVVLVGHVGSVDAFGLDEHERRLDGLVDDLREGRRRGLGGEGAGDRLVDLPLGERGRAG